VDTSYHWVRIRVLFKIKVKRGISNPKNAIITVRVSADIQGYLIPISSITFSFTRRHRNGMTKYSKGPTNDCKGTL